MQFNPSRFDFIKDIVVYTTVFQGAAYQSLHKRGNLSDEQAKKAFHREHHAQVSSMIAEQKKHTSQKIES